jgi:hypothetical protein
MVKKAQHTQQGLAVSIIYKTSKRDILAFAEKQLI